MNRRLFVSSLLAAPVAEPKSARIIAQVYVWVQEMARRKQPLAEGIDEFFGIVRGAGFESLELMRECFLPEARDRTMAAQRRTNLKIPIIYFGGEMHTEAGGEKTIATGLELARPGKDAGAVALVHNPSPKPQKALKTDEELRIQAANLNRLGEGLRSRGLELYLHHHDPEMLEGAREWRHILRNTKSELCSLTLDVDWVHRGGQNPIALLKEAGPRVKALHIRSTRNNVWLQEVTDSDIDYRAVAAELNRQKLGPWLEVELATQPGTEVTHSLEERLRRSREYVQKVFLAT